MLNRIRTLVLVGACAAGLAGIAADRAAAATTASVANGVLTVTGDKAGDKVALALASPTSLAIDVGEDGTTDFTFDRSAFGAVNVFADGGDDEVRVLNGTSLLGVPFTIDGGSGNDTLIGGDGAETLRGGPGDDFVDGNIGKDLAQLGSGNDRFQWDPGDGSDTVQGEGGDDALDFNGSNIGEHMAVSANGSHVRFTRDVAAIDMDLETVERVNVRTLGGADDVRVNDVTGTGLQAVDVDLASFNGDGDASTDVVTAVGTEGPDRVGFASPAPAEYTVSGVSTQVQVHAPEALDTLGVATLGGDDVISGNVTVQGPGSLAADGGADNDTTRYDGTSGDDQIGIARNGTAAVAAFGTGSALLNDTNVEELVVSGKDGEDLIAGQNGIGQLTHLTADGGTGDDNVRGGDGADLLLGGTGNDTVDGNIGADTARLGSGADTFQWDPGDGSDTVEGEGGKDVLAFNGSNIGEIVDVSANGSRARLTRNVAAISMDFGTIERVSFRALGGADVFNVGDLDGTDVQSVGADLRGFDGTGDATADVVTAAGTDGPDSVRFGSPAAGQYTIAGVSVPVDVLAPEAQDTVGVATLGGDDRIAADVTIPGPANLAADGGADNDTTRYDGTDGDDQIGIARNGAAAVAAFGTGSALLNDTNVEELVVSGKDGDDLIAGQNGIGQLTHLTADGGSGDDDVRGGDGADLLLGGTGDDSLDGNIGADTARAGAGDDRFQWDPGDGSDVVEGNSGTDRMAFNGSNIGENIDVAPDGSHVRLFRNVAAITMDFHGFESLGIRALGGADNLTVADLKGTGVKSVDADLGGFDGTPDAAADTVTLNGTEKRDVVALTRDGAAVDGDGLAADVAVTGSDPGLDRLQVNTLGGDDDVSVGPGVADLIVPGIDLGAGE